MSRSLTNTPNYHKMKRKLHFLNLLFIGSAFLLSSCTKEGPAGPAGPAGATGPQGPAGVGTIKTRDIVIPASSWSWSTAATLYLATVNNPDITTDVVTKGSVTAYLKTGNLWDKLPLVQFSSTGRVYNYRFLWSQGQMIFTQGFNDGNRSFTISQDTVRVVSIY
ncbi:hypothetical protein [Flavobacterium filum]|uniref:hypothetical protein n=1 Tax=Flavobacterium filum TaxID=370974 RepID=UPI0023F55B67|nr:hypothetical protein [Flavobacterium filum]